MDRLAGLYLFHFLLRPERVMHCRCGQADYRPTLYRRTHARWVQRTSDQRTSYKCCVGWVPVALRLRAAETIRRVASPDGNKGTYDKRAKVLRDLMFGGGILRGR